MDDTAHTDYVARRVGCNRWSKSPACWTFRLDDSEKHSCQSHYLDHLSQAFCFTADPGKTPTVGWRKAGNIVIAAVFGLAVAAIVTIGIVGFSVPTDFRVNVLTPIQVLVALAVMIVVTAIDLIMYRKAMRSSEINWGQMTDRSQYVLILLAITFTSLMGLMGYARSGLREAWHIFGVMPDTSPDAHTPLLADAV